MLNKKLLHVILLSVILGVVGYFIQRKFWPGE